MAIDASFWVAISFIIFLGALIYLKIPQKINEVLNKLISDIKNELDESEKLRSEAKTLLDNAQAKLDTAGKINKDILEQAKKDSENLINEVITHGSHWETAHQVFNEKQMAETIIPNLETRLEDEFYEEIEKRKT